MRSVRPRALHVVLASAAMSMIWACGSDPESDPDCWEEPWTCGGGRRSTGNAGTGASAGTAPLVAGSFNVAGAATFGGSSNGGRGGSGGKATTTGGTAGRSSSSAGGRGGTTALGAAGKGGAAGRAGAGGKGGGGGRSPTAGAAGKAGAPAFPPFPGGA